MAPALDAASGTIAEMHVSLSAFCAPIFVAAPALKMTAGDAPKQSERIVKATPNALFPVSLDDKRFALETHSDGALGRSSAVVPTQLRGIIVARATPENAK
ncbi:hypothetical protein [Methylocystis sp.]|uniref:hypothetical protein n=1 Tax=Methylocystis sp. TaxID=1911079 RepID=UPI002734F3D6|nr:hypothetical protein [Methylocystis sp.]MDP3552600.1 hypothetical protein [Methylocystis sp.]